MRHSIPLIFLLLVLSLPGTLEAGSPQRGIWFWYSDSSPYGAANVVGNPAREASALNFFHHRKITKVFGNYRDMPGDVEGTVANWNQQLHDAGIESQFLFSEENWITVSGRPTLINHLNNRVIDFNNAPGRPHSEKFKAVHLDLEPHKLTSFDTGTDADRREHLDWLQDTYEEVRDELDGAGLTWMKIHVDIPFWYDKMPADLGQIGWIDTTDRQDWFGEMGALVDGVHMMAFFQNSLSSINDKVAWEQANIPGAEVRIAIQPRIGPGETWADHGEFNDMMWQLENVHGFSGAVDIEHYRRWREELESLPILPVAATLAPAGAGFLAVEYKPKPHTIFILAESTNLCGWLQKSRRDFGPDAPQRAQFIVPRDTPAKFWFVYAFPNPPGEPQ